MRTFRHNRSRHGIISPNANSHQESETEDPDHLQGWCWNAVWETDDQDCADDADDEFFAIDELSTESVAHKTKGDLANYVADVGCSVYGTSKERWVGAVPVSGRLSPLSRDWWS